MFTQTKIAAVALTALTLTTALAATNEAQARPRFGVGLAAGALIGAAAASSAYAEPVYGYRDCRYVERYDRWGNIRMVRICDAY